MALLKSQTSFLDHLEQVPLRQRLWHVNSNIWNIPKCKTCGIADVRWNVRYGDNGAYVTFCSSKCHSNDATVIENRQKTCQVKYGHSTNLKCDETKSKIKQTLVDRYGVDNPFKAEEVKAKIRETNLEKYGFENAAKSEIVKALIDETNMARYGRKRQSQQHISEDIMLLKNDPTKMRELFFGNKMPITEIAELLGVSNSQLCVHFKTNLGIDISRHQVSTAERKLREYVETLVPDVRQSDRKIIAPKEIDIVIDSHKLAIELHGLAWHCENKGKSKTYHYNKMMACDAAGYRLVQITDAEWRDQTEIVKSRISSFLGKNSRIFARKCQVRAVSSLESALFLDENHIQGNCVSSLRYGLYNNNQLMCLMTFGKARFNKKVQWELLRFANAKFTNVVGGAGKLFSYFIRAHQPSSVISYCDLRWNTGGLYTKLGFTEIDKSGPNYWYTSRYIKLESRMRYQKHKLSEILPLFDPTKTEWENMQANGYDRFWDCGNKVFIWTTT